MKTKFFNWTLVVMLLTGLSLSNTSCSDDDDESEEQKQQEEAKKNNEATIFWSVVGQLADMSSYTEDYQDKTFEPTIGVAENGNELVRVVATNGMAAAVQRFNDLTGANITESTTTYEWKNDAVGTLTWTKGNSNQTWGTVDVNIKQMPHLQQIIYRDGDQMGENGSFSGAAYYRFGDVISKENGKCTEYWICVRPAFGPEKKEDSHWMCIGGLAESNIKVKTNGNDFSWKVPTGLGSKPEHMRNLAELIFAMLYPAEWSTNLQENPSLTVFHDFAHKNLKYHAVPFWDKVYKGWLSKNLFANIFEYSTNAAAIKALRESIAQVGLNFLYKGYSWSLWGNECTLYQANYSGLNLKTESLTEREVKMVQYPLDITADRTTRDAQLASFFGDNTLISHPRFIVRYASGKQLSSTGKFSVKEPIAGCTEVYRYYSSQTTLPQEPEVELTKTIENLEVGDIVAANGKFYGTGFDAVSQGTTPLAIIIYKGQDADKSYNATMLAMALEDTKFLDDGVTTKWIKDNYTLEPGDLKLIVERGSSDSIITDWSQDMNGYAASRAVLGDENVSEIGAALSQQLDINSITKNCSHWF
ncbi:MAG: hypothetical protein K5683_02535, partial [Prevotella sp.]|nr:hypothetical protein [Prevotella sp.]